MLIVRGPLLKSRLQSSGGVEPSSTLGADAPGLSAWMGDPWGAPCCGLLGAPGSVAVEGQHFRGSWRRGGWSPSPSARPCAPGLCPDSVTRWSSCDRAGRMWAERQDCMPGPGAVRGLGSPAGERFISLPPWKELDFYPGCKHGASFPEEKASLCRKTHDQEQTPLVLVLFQNGSSLVHGTGPAAGQQGQGFLCKDGVKSRGAHSHVGLSCGSQTYVPRDCERH